jgi:hypothetical protein
LGPRSAFGSKTVFWHRDSETSSINTNEVFPRTSRSSGEGVCPANTPTVTLGGAKSDVSFSGLASSLVGLLLGQ